MLGGQARPPGLCRLPACLMVPVAAPCWEGFWVPCRLPTPPTAGAWEPEACGRCCAGAALLMDGLILHPDMMPAVFVVCLPLR